MKKGLSLDRPSIGFARAKEFAGRFAGQPSVLGIVVLWIAVGLASDEVLAG